MKHKKIWNDRSGVAGVLVAVASVVVIIAVIAVAFVALAGGVPWFKNVYDPPDQDRDGDDEEDPIIGYISVSTEMYLDNRQLLGGFSRTVGEIDARFIGGTPPMQYSNVDPADIFRHDEELKMKFVITQPEYDFEFTAWDQQKITVHGGALEVVNCAPDMTCAVRYHGEYTVTCTIIEMSGTVVDSKSATVVV